MTFILSNKCRPFVLVINDKGTMVVPPQDSDCSLSFRKKNSIAPIFFYGHTDKSAIGVLKILADNKKKPFMFLVDTSAQDYKTSDIPNLKIWDRKKIAIRRLQEFTESPLISKAFLLDKNKILLASLPKKSSYLDLKQTESPLSFWQEKTKVASNLFLGISLLPLESSSIIGKLDDSSNFSEWKILLTFQQSVGLRQIVTKNNQFVFTRVTPVSTISESSAPFVMASLALDIQSTRDYLSRQGLDRDTPLHLIAILPSFLHPHFNSAFLPVQFRVTYSIQEASSKLDFSHSPHLDELSSDVLHAQWATSRSLKFRIQDTPTKNKIFHSRLKSIGILSTIFVWLLAISFFTHNYYNHRMETINLNISEEKIIDLNETTKSIERDLGPITEPLGKLNRAVERKRIFNSTKNGAIDLFNIFSSALTDDIRITKWEWIHSNGDESTESLSLGLHIVDPIFSTYPPEKQRLHATEIYTKLIHSLEINLSKQSYKIIVSKLPFSNDPNDILTNGIKIDDSRNAQIVIERGEEE